MTTPHSIPARGELLVDFPISTPGGATKRLSDVVPEGGAVVYFMRTATCPVCLQHVRKLMIIAKDDAPAGSAFIVVVPGEADDARSVAARRSGSSLTFVSATTGHAANGLFSTLGIQANGTFVVRGNLEVLSATTSRMPIGAFSEPALREGLTALAGVPS